MNEPFEYDINEELKKRGYKSYDVNMKNDKYKKARGGWSRILDIHCENCDQHICFYQKDGPGHLKRMYNDRMEGFSGNQDKLICPKMQNTPWGWNNI